MAKAQLELGSAELDVLKVLWDRGSCTVREVLDEFHVRGRRVAYTTVLTLLTRLEQKGAVASDKSEQAYVYRPKVTRERITATRLKTLVHQLYDGAATPLVLQLMQSEKFSPEEIAQLQQLIDRLEPKN
jgi:BlaI family transcriptional regulator, penicillinase repressor